MAVEFRYSLNSQDNCQETADPFSRQHPNMPPYLQSTGKSVLDEDYPKCWGYSVWRRWTSSWPGSGHFHSQNSLNGEGLMLLQNTRHLLKL